jgi:hypothetical protein
MQLAVNVSLFPATVGFIDVGTEVGAGAGVGIGWATEQPQQGHGHVKQEQWRRWSYDDCSRSRGTLT